MITKIANIEKNTLGMALFLINETVFFALLIFAFINYHAAPTTPTGPNGPTAANSLEPGFTAIFTAALLASSFTIWRADKSLERSNRRGMAIWLAITVALGLIFLVGQGWEYWRLLTSDVTVSRNLFGTTFFTLTGFHGFHVFAGLVMIGILTFFAFRGEFKGTKSGALSAISLYWHFVDVVWVIIFSIIYIWAAGVIKL